MDPKHKPLHYHETASCGLQVFVVRLMEHFRRFVPPGEDVKHSCILTTKISGLEEFAKENGARKISEATIDLPLGGIVSSSISASYNNTITTKTKRDEMYEFKGLTPNPAYLASVVCVQFEYGRIQASQTSFVFARNEQQAESIISQFQASEKDRLRKKKSIISYNGEEMSEFRRMDWDRIILPGKMTSDIQDEIKTFFRSKEMYDKHFLDWRRGILLAGPPGNGKTAICRAIASTAEYPVIYCVLDTNDMFGMLENAKETISRWAPCVAIFEDADSIGGDEIVRSSLLNMLDGLFSSGGVFVVATTNSPEKLDAALTGRPSRFDSFYVVPNPAPAERSRILVSKLGDKASGLKKKFIDKIAASMDSLSAAAIQEVACHALKEAMLSKKPVSEKSLLDGLEKIKMHMRYAKDGIDKVQKGDVGFGSSRRLSSKYVFEDDSVPDED